MGNQLGSINGSSTVSPRDHLPPISLSMEQLRSYQATRDKDQEIRQFDTQLHLRTSRAVDALSIGADQPLPFSLDLLREVTGCLLDSNQQVVDHVLASKKDIWNNPELFSLVDDYFKTSLHTLDFCASLERFLTTAKLKQAILRSTLKRLSESVPGQDEYKKALEDLGRFRSEETHFTEEVLQLFGTVYTQQLQLLERLQAQRDQLDKKLKRIKRWKKTACVIFAVTVVTVLICSIVAAAITAPPVVTAVVTVLGAAATWAPTENWFNVLWRKFESAAQEKREVVSAIQAGTIVALRDLDNIRFLVESLEAELSNLVEQISNGDGVGAEDVEGGGVRLVIQEIETKVCSFTRNVEELGKYVDCCSRNVHKARSVVLQRIMKPK